MNPYLLFKWPSTFEEVLYMVLDVQNITKIYKGPSKSKIVANDHLTFDIDKGEIFGLLGHNGAGKTTLVHQIMGTLMPTSGNITLHGKSVQKFPKRARSLCSLQPQSEFQLGFLTPAQAVSTMGKMRGGSKKEVKQRMDMLFEKLKIGKWAHTHGVRLSGGIRRLTVFCMAVIQPGNLVILDEPTNDVDPTRRRYLWDVIRELTSDGTSVILVTHNVIEAEKAVDRLAILHKGQFAAKGTVPEVKRKVSDQKRLEINLSSIFDRHEDHDWSIATHRNGANVIYSLDESSVLTAIEWAETQLKQGKILDYTLSPKTLEDVYVELTATE